mmetsp:Transcript_9190/g.15661  ORF Transcript_9190/g.15661 Transcript_9190/m.15661 type:complete len:496 (-) Transcript_9190:168-1655(-)
MDPQSGQRPQSQSRVVHTPSSEQESLGIRTFHPDSADQTVVMERNAEELSSDVTDVIFQTVLRESPANVALKEQATKLEADLENAKGEMELAALKEEELQKRWKQAQDLSEELQEQVKKLNEQLEEARGPSGTRGDSDVGMLRAKVSELETEVSGLQHELSIRQASTVVPGDGEQMSFSAAASEENSLLGAAYQQISVLNTQLAHLYTELTMARTEAASIRAEKEQLEADDDGGANAEKLAAAEAATAAAQTENQRQAGQIADLVSDIRHLQLDLEYHQQKVDQLLEEKQMMMKDMKSLQQEVAEARQQLEEKDQLLKHQEVDLMHYRQMEQQSPRAKESDDGIIDALRTEAAAKDSALIVSHYELHKEKLMRDRLEQKNLKLMERMQKLMMVVETMRRDNVNLERTLASKDRMYEEKDAQLRIIMQKLRQVQKSQKGGKPKVASKQKAPVLELEGSMQNLPLLDSGRRSGSANGRRSGQNTPRASNGSPYTTRP